MKNSVESVENAAEKKERRNIKVMDLILVIVGVSLLVFTIVIEIALTINGEPLVSGRSPQGERG